MISIPLGIAGITAGMSVLVILLAILMRTVGKKFTAECRYVLWVLIILRLAVPISISAIPALIEIPVEDNKFEAGVFVAPSDAIPSQAGTDIIGSVGSPMNSPAHDSVVFPPKAPDLTSDLQAGNTADTVMSTTAPAVQTKAGSFKQALAFLQAEGGLRIISAVYFAGAALFLIWNLVSYSVFTRRIMKKSTEPDESVYDILRSICRRYGVKHVPELRVCDGISSPIAFGLFRRRIVLPNIGSDDSSLYGTLSHELVHCKRGDLYIKFLMLIARSLHWFNPLVHFAAVRCEMEMELSCDEAVLYGCSTEDRIAYGEMMLSTVKRCRYRSDALTTHFNPKKYAVKARLLNILNGCGKRQGKVLIASCVILCMLAGTVLAYRLPDNTLGDTRAEADGGDENEADTPIPPSIGDKTPPDGPIGTETDGIVDDATECVPEYDQDGMLTAKSYYSDGKVTNIEKYDIYGSIISVEIYTYNDNGQLVKKAVIGKYVGNDVTEYEYYGDGTLKLKTKYDNNISADTPKERYFYDEKGRLTQSERYFADGYVKYASAYEYYSDGTRKMIANYNQDSSARYFYDEKGKLIKAEEYSGDGSVESVSKYEYDADGKLVTASTIGPRIAQTIAKYEYYENGAVKTYTEYGEGDVPHFRKYYEYNEGGAPETCIIYGADDTPQYKLYYDENGRTYKEVAYNADGSILRVKDYEYDSEGRVSEVKIKDYSGVDIVKYEYHSNGAVSKEAHYGSDSAVDVISYYNEESSEVRREYFSSDGKMTEWTDFDRHADWSIDCASYLVRSDGTSYLYEKSFWKDCRTIESLTQYGEDGSSTVTMFDENGTPVSYIYYDADGNITDTVTP